MVYKGSPASHGVVIGEVLRFDPVEIAAVKNLVEATQCRQELARFVEARKAALQELERICGSLGGGKSDESEIVSTQLDLLCDPVAEQEIECGICEACRCAEWAVEDVYDKYIKILANAEDNLIRQRAVDLEDVKNRILRCLNGLPEQNLSILERPVVVVARDIMPSHAAAIDRKNVLAIVTEQGGPASHTAILAKSYEIPAVLGVTGLMENITDGDIIIVDAVEGHLILGPDEFTTAKYTARAENFLKISTAAKKYVNSESKTADGTKVYVEVNIAKVSKEELGAAEYADGVGLMRTEFLYMGRATLPDEEEQVRAYSRVFDAFRDKPVILRTLDVGGDKPLDSVQMPKEANPTMGSRAIRFCQRYPDIFLTQLRAALRAAEGRTLDIMFPMVADLSDIEFAREYIEKAKFSLMQERLPFCRDVNIGVMIEVPALALMPDIVAKHVDFASIGTNDLCQYTLAADRQNPLVAKCYQNYHPAILRMIQKNAAHFAHEGKAIGICGEIAGDPYAIPLLLGLGIRRFSMGIPSVGYCKQILSCLTVPKAEAIAARALEMQTHKEVEQYLKQEFSNILGLY